MSEALRNRRAAYILHVLPPSDCAAKRSTRGERGQSHGDTVSKWKNVDEAGCPRVQLILEEYKLWKRWNDNYDVNDDRSVWRIFESRKAVEND